jgi:hypothetical protein
MDITIGDRHRNEIWNKELLTEAVPGKALHPPGAPSRGGFAQAAPFAATSTDRTGQYAMTFMVLTRREKEGGFSDWCSNLTETE